MNKVFSVFVLGTFLAFIGMSFVSAGPVESIQEFVESAYSLIQPVLEKIIGDTSSSDMFLAKILFLIIIFAIVWKSLENISFFEATPWVLWLVSVSVSIIAIRWFGNSDIVNTVLLPYSAFGITLTAALPFVLYFFIVKDFHTSLRKISWTFFIVVFIGLWFMRSGAGELQVGNFAYIYLAVAGLGLLVLMFDGTIQRIVSGAKIDRYRSVMNTELLDRLRDKIRDADKRYADGDINETEHKKRIDATNKKIAKLVSS